MRTLLFWRHICLLKVSQQKSLNQTLWAVDMERSETGLYRDLENFSDALKVPRSWVASILLKEKKCPTRLWNVEKRERGHSELQRSCVKMREASRSTFTRALSWAFRKRFAKALIGTFALSHTLHEQRWKDLLPFLSQEPPFGPDDTVILTESGGCDSFPHDGGL